MKLTLRSQLLASMLVALSALPIGCATFHRDGDESAAIQRRVKKLRPGMSYTQVASALRPVDPEIKVDIKDVLEEERQATIEYNRVVKELQAAGVQDVPKMRSAFTLDRSDYVLEFENGKLTSWSVR